jgi:hypothetical protein
MAYPRLIAGALSLGLSLGLLVQKRIIRKFLFVKGSKLTIWANDITIFSKGTDFPSYITKTDPVTLLGANATDPAKITVNAQGWSLLSAADAVALRRLTKSGPLCTRAIDFCEHFLTGSALARFNTNTSTGTAAHAVVDNRHGVMRLLSSVTATSNARASVGGTGDTSAIDLSLGETVLIADVALSTALFDGTNVGVINLGFGDSTGTGDHTDSVDFVTTNGGVWNCRTRSNSVSTTTVTAVNANTLDVFKQFVIRVSASGTLVDFYIDGTLVASHTANIPIGNTRRLTVLYKTRKTSAHTVSAGIDVDFIRLYQEETAPIIDF